MDSCSLCGRALEKVPNGLLRCPFHGIYFKDDNYQRTPAPIGASPDDLSEAQRNWLMDAMSEFTTNPMIKRRLYEIGKRMFTDMDFWDVVHNLRRETGAHAHTILDVMRKAMERNPAARREVEKEGVLLPFMQQAARTNVKVAFEGEGKRKRRMSLPL